MVSEACQINDLDHRFGVLVVEAVVSEACQINDLDHHAADRWTDLTVSEACQINDLDHAMAAIRGRRRRFRSLSDQ